MCDRQQFPGLTDALQVAERDMVLVATSTSAPLFRKAAEQTAAVPRIDLTLLRVGKRRDGALPVSANVTLAALPHVH